MYLAKYNLTGKIAFVTGGGRGIGLASAQALAECGARVVISDRDPAVLEAGLSELRKQQAEAEGLVLDVTDAAGVTAAADDLNGRLGAVDILVANAGIAWPDTGAEEMEDAVWLKMIDVNLNGCFWSCRAFGRYMLTRERGSIVTVGSMSGVISNRPQRQAHYNAAKAAVHHMTRSLAGEWAARGVRVNAVAPTYVDTAMSGAGLRTPELANTWLENTPAHRAVTAGEIASVILFLAADASSALMGSIVLADAGYTIW
ncbi:SDR family NAD(P)-dependent oxidoreductase [Acidisoma sp.]|uniref:SDR family NAD(P)-dependent oxidoreductase n=1 Tax=Acidisoma sp. TaxID=1872115 RepID=UPI003B00B88D